MNLRYSAFLKQAELRDSAPNCEYMIFIMEMKKAYLSSVGDEKCDTIHGTISDHDAFTKFIEEYMK